jgi:hypothetical protein
MSHQRIRSWIVSVCAAWLCASAPLFAQSGPTVQVFTSASSGQTRVMPLERLPFSVTVSANAGYDTNVATSSNNAGAFFSSASLGLSYGFGTERTRASLSWGTSVTYYDDGNNADFNFDPNTSLQLGLTHAVSERLNLSSGIFVHYGIEPDFFSGVGENRRTGNYFYTADSFAASYQWLERFSTVTSYSIGVLKYEDEARAAFLDRYEHGLSQQFRFMLLPMTTVIADYRIGLVDYETDGRDSFSQYFLGGVSQTLGPRLQGSLFAGAQLRSSDQESENSFAPYVSGSVSFTAGEKTFLTWTAQYSTQESDVVGATSRTSFSTGLQLSYGITPRIGSSVSAFYRHDENTLPEVLAFAPDRGFFLITPSFAEDALDLSLNLSYSITARLSAGAGVQYTEVWSEFTTRPYTRARYSGGITYSF